MSPRKLVRLSGAIALLILGPCFAGCGGEDEPAPATPATKDWTKDDRLVEFLSPCGGLGRFAGDTSEMLPVLVRKLQNSQLNVLRNVREELARAGQPAVVELERVVRELYTDPHGSHTIVNALGVLELSDEGGCPEGLRTLSYCLEHPQETVRSAAILALARHAAPEHYDDLTSLLRIHGEATRGTIFTALHVADSGRFEADLARWMAAGEYPGQWARGARLVASSADQKTSERFAEIALVLPDLEARAFLLAVVSESGGGAALESLLTLLDDPDPQLRAFALAALEYTDEREPVVKVLAEDPVPALRSMAASLLGPHAAEKRVRDALFAGVSDANSDVRLSCMLLLQKAGDSATADYVLTLLDGPRPDLELAHRACRDAWEHHPGLPERALAILARRHEEIAEQPLAEREFLVQAIASVPGTASARLVLEIARAAADEKIHRMSGFRWVAMQAGNAGPEGHQVLMAAWREEADPERRMDLLWPATGGHDDATREFLIEVLQAGRTLPHERLYVAERLAEEGPASEVARLIKRAALRMGDPVFRPAMECLLWRWYG